MPEYLEILIKDKHFKEYVSVKANVGNGVRMNFTFEDMCEWEIPLPGIEEQEVLINNYEKIIHIKDALIHLEKNIKLDIPISEHWKYEKLGNISINLDNQRIPITSSERNAGEIPYYGASGIVDYVDKWIFDEELLLVSEDGANLKSRTYPIAFIISGKSWVNNHCHVLKFENHNLTKFVEYYINSINVEKYLSGSTQPKLNQGQLGEILIPVPSDNELECLAQKIDDNEDFLDNIRRKKKEFDASLNSISNNIWGEE